METQQATISPDGRDFRCSACKGTVQPECASCKHCGRMFVFDSSAGATLTSALVGDLSRRLFGKRLLVAIPVAAAALLAGPPQVAEAGTDGDWTLSGNSLLDDTQFLGTTNSLPLIFKTTATDGTAPAERMRITPDGNVGIGSTSPSARLTVQTSSNNAIYASSSSSYGVYGSSSSSYGMRGSSSTSIGIFGSSLSNIGVLGQSTSGAGVIGNHSGTSGTSAGVSGQTASTDTGAVGVQGTALATTGANYGVWGITSSTSLGSAGIRGQATWGYGVWGEAPSGVGVWGKSTAGFGVRGDSTSNIGVKGYSSSNAGVKGDSTSNIGVQGSSVNGIGVQGSSVATIGVYGTSTSSIGVQGYSSTAVGVRGESSTSAGVYGKSTSSHGVFGSSPVAGVTGNSSAGVGVRGASTSFVGVWGSSTSNVGVYGTSTSSYGVQGISSKGFGVRGSSGTGYGVYGTSASFIGVHGSCDAKGGYGVFGGAPYGYGVLGASQGIGAGWAGFFRGNVEIIGSLVKSSGSSKIDHPLNPENKYLYHSFVESPDMKNVYDGVVTLDSKGEAIVELPTWFEALNDNFRYQLTCIGGFAPVYISDEIANNRFSIAGGQAGMKVSWQVTGIRKDAYAQAHRIPIEEDKPEADRGTYLHPDAYGQPETKQQGYAEFQRLQRRAQAEAQAPIEPIP